MALTEQDKLDRIAGAVYRKIMSMESVENFKNLVKTITPEGFKNFIKTALQETIDADGAFLTELGKVKKDIGS